MNVVCRSCEKIMVEPHRNLLGHRFPDAMNCVCVLCYHTQQQKIHVKTSTRNSWKCCASFLSTIFYFNCSSTMLYINCAALYVFISTWWLLCCWLLLWQATMKNQTICYMSHSFLLRTMFSRRHEQIGECLHGVHGLDGQPVSRVHVCFVYAVGCFKLTKM